jgi:hypothetical protein
MSRFELTGLRGDSPVGMMAALGTLRICARRSETKGATLGWNSTGGAPIPVLWTTTDLSREDLIGVLQVDVQSAAERPHLKWNDQIKTATPDDYHAATADAAAAATANDRESADWFAAFGSELAVGRDGRLDPTPLDMTTARQRFLFDALRLGTQLAEDRVKRTLTRDAYAEALFGPWRYADDQHSLGWDPSTLKLGAFTYKAPTTMANAGVRAAVWLAFESLPFFPCFYHSEYPRGLRVRGFERNGREFVLRWPIWSSALSLDAISTLIGLAASSEDDDLMARGVTAVYRSERFKPNQYLSSFRPAELVFGVSSAAAG